MVYAVAAATLPSADCDGVSDEASGFAQAVALAVTAGASLGCLAAAARHLVRLRRAGHRRAPLGIGIVAAVLALGAIVIATGGDGIAPYFFAGLIATALCFVATLAFAASGRGIDRVGIAWPLYLTGMAIFLYPAVLFVFALGNSGLGC